MSAQLPSEKSIESTTSTELDKPKTKGLAGESKQNVESQSVECQEKKRSQDVISHIVPGKEIDFNKLTGRQIEDLEEAYFKNRLETATNFSGKILTEDPIDCKRVIFKMIRPGKNGNVIYYHDPKFPAFTWGALQDVYSKSLKHPSQRKPPLSLVLPNPDMPIQKVVEMLRRDPYEARRQGCLISCCLISHAELEKILVTKKGSRMVTVNSHQLSSEVINALTLKLKEKLPILSFNLEWEIHPFYIETKHWIEDEYLLRLREPLSHAKKKEVEKMLTLEGVPHTFQTYEALSRKTGELQLVYVLCFDAIYLHELAQKWDCFPKEPSCIPEVSPSLPSSPKALTPQFSSGTGMGSPPNVEVSFIQSAVEKLSTLFKFS